MQIKSFTSPDEANSFWLKKLTVQLEKWTTDIHRDLDTKYNPHQPRVPRGSSNGGQWTDNTGSTGEQPRTQPGTLLPRRKPAHLTTPKTPHLPPSMTAEELARFNRRAPRGTPPEDLEIDPRFGLPRWYVSGAVSSTVSPLDIIGGAGAAVRSAGSLMKTTVTEAAAAVRVLRARYAGRRATEESVDKIRKAADSVEDFLGGRPNPKDVKINPRGDITIIKDNKKFRMDINNPGSNYSGRQDDPHFHLLEKRNGRWRDATDIHRHYFKKD